MTAYIIRRLLYTIPLILGVTILVFSIFDVMGDPALILAGKYASPEQIAEIRAELGLDKAKPVQYLKYLKDVILFRFGDSLYHHRPISDLLKEGWLPSITLTVPAFFLSTAFAVSLALICASRRNKFIDRFFVIFAVAGMSISALVYIKFGQYFLAGKLGWFEIQGYEKGIEGMKYFFLPILIWLVVGIAPDLRFYRTVILEEIYRDYVRTARSKGLSGATILFKHVLRNIMIPILTRVVVAIPFLFVGSLLLEKFFGIPGLGRLTVDAVFNNDQAILKAMTFLFALAYIFANLLTDLMYAAVDPRVRLQ